VRWQLETRENTEQRNDFCRSIITRKIEATIITLEKSIPRSDKWERAKSAYAALSRLEENPPENISELLNEPSLISILMPRTLSPSHRTPINVDRFVRGEQNLRIGRRLVADWCGFLRGGEETLCVNGKHRYDLPRSPPWAMAAFAVSNEFCVTPNAAN
jgi:hypothetical protein